MGQLLFLFAVGVQALVRFAWFAYRVSASTCCTLSRIPWRRTMHGGWTARRL